MKNLIFHIKHLPSGLRVFTLALFILWFSSLAAQNAKAEDQPGARWGHVFIYDPVRHCILLFGGAPERGVYLDDTWIWDRSGWRKLEVSGPLPRGFCAVAFHEDRGTIILHGGRGLEGATYSDLWEWNGTDWKQLEPDGDYRADHHQMVYMPGENHLFAFGGWNGKGVLDETWVWSGKWKQLSIPGPPKRASLAMCYNKSTATVSLFGGLWINGQYADIWSWYAGKWHAVGGPYDNSSLDHHSMIYDEKLQKIIGFGGKNYRYQARSETFTMENNKIVTIPVEGPSARHSFGFTYDHQTGVGYLYGGKEYEGREQIAMDDFWKWDGRAWLKIE